MIVDRKMTAKEAENFLGKENYNRLLSLQAEISHRSVCPDHPGMVEWESSMIIHDEEGDEMVVSMFYYQPEELEFEDGASVPWEIDHIAVTSLY